ncbi:MAG: chromophore lyase CpcT/CpeT [Cyanobacteria bacterium SBLK]|nr:chromophore lyase CpcT/CpeT [Cyanobacteria bacterium SBLK]
MRLKRSLAIALGVLGYLVVGSFPAYGLPVEEQMEEVVSHLVGIMETIPKTTDSPRVRMTTCRVKMQGETSIFLYQEQALTYSLEHPYRQRFLNILSDRTETRIFSRSFKPLELEKWVGFCHRPIEERVIQRSDMGVGFCSVFIVLVEDTYVGKTPEEGCPTHYRGATRMTNTIILHADGMDTWDRGFNAEGDRIWGAEDEPYRFRWVERE